MNGSFRTGLSNHYRLTFIVCGPSHNHNPNNNGHFKTKMQFVKEAIKMAFSSFPINLNSGEELTGDSPLSPFAPRTS